MRIPRFNKTTRILHWSHTIVFIWLLITGIQLFLTQKSLLGDPLIKMIHLYASPFLVLLPLVVYITGRKSARGDVNELMRLTGSDFRWFMDFIKGHRSPDIGKFNGGQKMNFLGAVLLITGFSFSGYVIWMKSMFSVDFVEFNFLLHDFLTVLALLILAGHIIFTLYYSESLRGIIYGTVDEKWAQEHYPKWYRMCENKEKN